MAIDAERVGERERHLSARRMRQARRLAERLLGGRWIEEIPLEIHDLPSHDQLLVDIGGRQSNRRAEERAQRPRRSCRHGDQASAGRRSAARQWRVVSHTGRAQIMCEYLAEIVLADLADVVGAAAERRDADHGVRGGPPRHLDTGSHRRVQLTGALLVDQMHGALREPMPVEELVVLVTQDVDHRVSYADHVDLVNERWPSHAPSSVTEGGSTCPGGARGAYAWQVGTRSDS